VFNRGKITIVGSVPIQRAVTKEGNLIFRIEGEVDRGAVRRTAMGKTWPEDERVTSWVPAVPDAQPNDEMRPTLSPSGTPHVGEVFSGPTKSRSRSRASTAASCARPGRCRSRPLPTRVDPGSAGRHRQRDPPPPTFGLRVAVLSRRHPGQDHFAGLNSEALAGEVLLIKDQGHFAIGSGRLYVVTAAVVDSRSMHLSDGSAPTRPSAGASNRAGGLGPSTGCQQGPRR
jgi:hypothetical protein